MNRFGIGWSHNFFRQPRSREVVPRTPTSESADLAIRLREVRLELFGEHGGPLLAEKLRIPSRALFNYESGVTVPAVMLLRFIRITKVCPEWLMIGEGRKYAPCDRPERITAGNGVGDPTESR